jgi:hypothetical protein
MDDLPSRVAVLEQIARETHEAIMDLRAEMRALRGELAALRAEARADYRWLLGITLGGVGALLAVMAHGFHWL